MRKKSRRENWFLDNRNEPNEWMNEVYHDSQHIDETTYYNWMLIK